MRAIVWISLLLHCTGCTFLFLARCGDEITDVSTEECDDGNTNNNDGCDSSCRLEAVCGDNLVVPPEECDDGDQLNNDGCSALCLNEFCGDGLINNNATESCDDGNLLPGDGCDQFCQLEIPLNCGDGIPDTGEECDEGPNNSQDPNAICRINCQLADCGDAILDDLFGEECDDGNNLSGDGCSVICLLEDVSICGDGFPEALEECDDGNTNNNDGCDADCNLSTVIQISAGGAHTCALLRSGDVRCWGEADNGRLGYGNLNDIGDDETPASIGDVNLGQPAAQIVTGSAHTCALFQNGVALCWGANDSGQLGQGNNQDLGDDELLSAIPPIFINEAIVQLTAGDDHTCALTSVGTVFCWGAGSGGVLGYGNSNDIGDNETPASVGPVVIGGVATQITAGAGHTCALLSDGRLRCWGNNAAGQLGLGSINNIGDNETPESAGPVEVGNGVSQVSAGGSFTCVRFNTGDLKCWGLNDSGQLGQGNTVTFGDNTNELPIGLAPIDVNANLNASQLDAGGSHVCALFDGALVHCWGRGSSGQLGLGSINNIGDTESPGALSVNVGASVLEVSAGEIHSCARTTNGAVRCWGSGANGRLGYGSPNNIGDTEPPASAGNVPVF